MEGSALIEKYSSISTSPQEASQSLEFHQKVMSYKPDWSVYESTKGTAQMLRILDPRLPVSTTKVVLMGNPSLLQACMDTLSLTDEKPLQWVLTVLHDSIRADASILSIIETGLGGKLDVYKPIVALLSRQTLDPYVADKAAWILTATIGHLPQYFTEQQVVDLVGIVLDSPSHAVTALGQLEAITNLLKADAYRSLVWSQAGVGDCIFKVEARTTVPSLLYKCVFAIWMLTYDDAIVQEIKSWLVVDKIKEIMMYSRVEKVIRLSLTVLRNLLMHKSVCEDIVEKGLLDTVQALEYEKWRDAELYDDIREMENLVASEVQAMSNFDRYERELETGKLTWGYIHSSKFWAENVMKFDAKDYRALKQLAMILLDDKTDAQTLAVACRDIGEFVTLHPLGKKKVNELQIKDRVMQLMGSEKPEHRDVRREALLCCQKIMLNKWQDLDRVK